jgi:cation diffusion facilitator family transporter
MGHTTHIHNHDYLLKDSKIKSNEKKTLIVVLLTFVTMVIEVSFGYLTGSMALLADGWHMASHVGALGISLIAYKLARSSKMEKKFSFGTGKFVPLGGYTSAIMLGLVALFMGVESVIRFLNPVTISFSVAILVSVVGLVVNVVSAIILSDSHEHHHNHDQDNINSSNHHKEHVHDHNHQSALIHVIADALTSVLAIVALLLGKYFGWHWADPMMGIVGSIVILKWAYNLCKATVWELLDGNSKTITHEQIKSIFLDVEDAEVSDLHIWRVAPNAIACEMMVYNNSPKGSEFYRKRILREFAIEHLIIEERTWSD